MLLKDIKVATSESTESDTAMLEGGESMEGWMNELFIYQTWEMEWKIELNAVK